MYKVLCCSRHYYFETEIQTVRSQDRLPVTNTSSFVVPIDIMLKLGLLYFAIMGCGFAFFLSTNPDGFLETYQLPKLGNSNSDLLVKHILRYALFLFNPVHV